MIKDLVDELIGEFGSAEEVVRFIKNDGLGEENRDLLVWISEKYGINVN